MYPPYWVSSKEGTFHKSQFLQEEMLISMKMTSPYYGTLVMMPLGQK